MVMERMRSACPATTWPPPKTPPEELRDEYLMYGEAAYKAESYKYQRYDGATARVPRWSTAYIEELQRHRHNISVYKTRIDARSSATRVDAYVTAAFSRHRTGIEGGVGMVIGTEKPWVEAHLLNAGEGADTDWGCATQRWEGRTRGALDDTHSDLQRQHRTLQRRGRNGGHLGVRPDRE